ncbi:MAG: deoxyribose-phosphate aldolase [Acidaminococcaceae bacterium]|nr:deoxyribose-phosphate aldolase [Acidaminococcaceae bacterium]
MSIAKYLEHTLLKPEAKVTDIMQLCAEAKAYNLGGVCVNPCYAGLTRHLLRGTDVKVVTVVGFPLGADRTEVKALATKLAVEEDQVDEVDMVMNMAAFKSGNFDGVVEDIAAVVEAAKPYPVKVIIETCLLTEDEKVVACGLVAKGGAAFIKTSTGFNKDGTTLADVQLLAREAKRLGIGVKAAGGIRNYETAKAMVGAGADRIGTSAGVAICLDEEKLEGGGLA